MVTCKPEPAAASAAARLTAAPSGGGLRLLAGALLLAGLRLLAAPAPLAAYESDQYSNRLVPVADSLAPLDAEVNDAIAGVAAHWQGPRNPWRFALEVYRRLGGIFWVDKIERWAMKSPEVEKLPQERRHSIYADAPLWATRVNFVFGVGRTLEIGGVLVGSDKLGHFFSQGLKYYQSFAEGKPEAAVLRRGEVGERWLFGQLTTGVYSNADLVANYEGYLFYRSLSEDGVVPGKPAIVAWREGKPVVQRAFDWRDHVNDYWDEALNPSHFAPSLQRYMAHRLRALCADYRRRPDAFVPRDGAALARRYADLGMRPAPENRLDRVCAQAAEATALARGE
jgi:hypothetical protein